MIAYTLPIRTVSEANRASHEHWRARQKRAKEQRTHAGLVSVGRLRRLKLPTTITLTRISPGVLDDDNLPVSMKHVRDGIADALSVDDRDPRITWRYAQERGKRGEYAVRVEVNE